MAVDERWVFVLFGIPIVIPRISDVVVFGMFLLAAGSAMGLFRG